MVMGRCAPRIPGMGVRPQNYVRAGAHAIRQPSAKPVHATGCAMHAHGNAQPTVAGSRCASSHPPPKAYVQWCGLSSRWSCCCLHPGPLQGAAQGKVQQPIHAALAMACAVDQPVHSRQASTTCLQPRVVVSCPARHIHPDAWRQAWSPPRCA